MPRITALLVLRSTMKTVSAPASSSFRGSLPHPMRPLCTLRVRRHRRLTRFFSRAYRHDLTVMAVDAVAFLGEIDPHQPDRILRARRDRQLAMGVNALEPEFWIVMVGRVASDLAHLVSAAWRWLLLATDRSRIECDEFAVLAERA